MTNWVSLFIRKIFIVLYCAFYVVVEDIGKASWLWPPLYSITGAISFIITFPLCKAIELITLHWLKYEISDVFGFVIVMSIFLSIDWALDRFYSPISREIEQNVKAYSRIKKLSMDSWRLC